MKSLYTKPKKDEAKLKFNALFFHRAPLAATSDRGIHHESCLEGGLRDEDLAPPYNPLQPPHVRA